MNVKMRYVTARPSTANPERWYWQRPGYPLTRLPDDPAERWGMAERLNKQADGTKDQAPADGTVAWCIEQYLTSPRYTKKSYSTRRIYGRWCEWFKDAWGGRSIAKDITPALVQEFCNNLDDKQASRGQAVAVLSTLFEVARFNRIKVENPCHHLRLSSAPPRQEYWLPAHEEAFLKYADPRLRLTFTLLLYTAQRPGDVLAMTWKQWNGETIKLRQEKTKSLVEVPCHANLKAALAGLSRGDGTIAGWPHGGRPRYNAFNYAFRTCAQDAGLAHLQARDLRRTAVVRMSEAGASVPRIAAVTGHSIESTQQIIDTYYTRTLPMAQEAIALWEVAEQKRRRV